MSPYDGDALSKALEDGRAARRERVREEVASLPPGSVIVCHNEIARPRKPRPKRFSQRKVDAIRREIEVGIEDALNDNPEYTADQVAHDIAWSVMYCHRDEHPDTLERVGVHYGVSRTSLN